MIIDRLDSHYDVVLDLHKGLLYLRITILPGRAANIVAIEIADRSYVPSFRLFLGTAGLALPIQFVANAIRLGIESADLEADATAYPLVTEGAVSIGVKCVDFIGFQS